MPRSDRPPQGVDCSKPIIGLVGGIGAGKSQAAALFAERGARVIDADALGHEALEQPAIKARIVERWGPEVLAADGTVNRRNLGGRVFKDPAQRRALQALVFPWIDRRIREEIAAAAADPQVRLIVLDAAIMLETGWDSVCRRIVFIDAPPQRLARLAERRGWNEAELTAREQAQMSVADKRRRADDVVLNDGSPADLAGEIDRWFATNFLRG